MSNHQRAHLAMMLFAILIAGSFSLGKLAMPYISPGLLNSIRFALATFLIGAWAFGWQKLPCTFPSRPWRFVVFGGILATYFVTMFIALETTSPVATSAIFTLTPMLSAIVAGFVLKQNLHYSVIVSLVVAAIGSIWVIFSGDLTALSAFKIGYGETVFLGGAIAYSFYAPLSKKWRGPEPLLVQTFWVLFMTTVFLVLYSLPTISVTDISGLPGITWIAIFYLALFATAITNHLLQFATLHLPSAKVMAYVYLTPVIVIFLEGMGGRGWASLSVMLGALAIVLGLVVLYFSPDH